MHERVAAAITPQVRHVIVSGIVEGEMRAGARGSTRRWACPRQQGMAADTWIACGWGARMADLLDPDRAAEAGAAIGQLASRLPDGGLLISASRLVEINCRAAILIAPGLFRLDLTPQQETLGVRRGRSASTACTGRPRRRRGTPTASRPPGRAARAARAGRHPGDPMLAWVHVLSFTDRDAAAVHFVAKAELRRPDGV